MKTKLVQGRHINKDPSLTFAKVCDLPEYLTSDDGRVFRIKTWNPLLSYDSPVTVMAEMLIEVPDQ